MFSFYEHRYRVTIKSDEHRQISCVTLVVMIIAEQPSRILLSCHTEPPQRMAYHALQRNLQFLEEVDQMWSGLPSPFW